MTRFSSFFASPFILVTLYVLLLPGAGYSQYFALMPDTVPTDYPTADGWHWSPLGGANALTRDLGLYCICCDPSGNVYAGGRKGWIHDSGIVLKYDGQAWHPLGRSFGKDHDIRTLCSDPAGNIYAGGFISNNAGKCYVAKYDGKNWTELGGRTACRQTDMFLTCAAIKRAISTLPGSLPTIVGKTLNGKVSRTFTLIRK